jgi:hypothetical protein
MSPRIRAALPLLAAVVVLLALAADAAACPNCKNTVKATSDAGVGDPALGFAVSIYAMLGSVLGIAGFVGWKIVRAARRAEHVEPD